MEKKKFLFLTFCLLSSLKLAEAQNILDVMNGKSVDEVKLLNLRKDLLKTLLMSIHCDHGWT